MKRLLFQSALAGILIYLTLYSVAFAWEEIGTPQEEKTRLVLTVDPVAANASEPAYAYRKVNHERTIALMLYGFQDQPTGLASIIPKDRKALGGFFKQHLDRVKRDYLGQNNPTSLHMATGDDAFTSLQMNRGLETKPAKMAGFTMPVGKLTFGGGYLWGEKNPAVMMPKPDGLFAGFSYNTGSTGFQLSYITAGQNVMGFNVGGTAIQYSSVLFGTSFKVNPHLSVTATLQYRNDDDELTTGQRAGVATLGTSWKF